MLFNIVKYFKLIICFLLIGLSVAFMLFYWYKHNRFFNKLINKILKIKKLLILTFAIFIFNLILIHFIKIVNNTKGPIVMETRYKKMLCYQDVANYGDQHCRTATNNEIKYLKPNKKYNCKNYLPPNKCFLFIPYF